MVRRFWKTEEEEKEEEKEDRSSGTGRREYSSLTEFSLVSILYSLLQMVRALPKSWSIYHTCVLIFVCKYLVLSVPSPSGAWAMNHDHHHPKATLAMTTS